jgi:MerR family transcriptional regulator/heat shock protein HspR
MADQQHVRHGAGPEEHAEHRSATGDRTIHQVMPDGRIVGEIRTDTPVFVISVAAELAGMHAQTLRSYDREGLVSPGRTSGGGRRYSQRDIELLQQVQRLSQDEGVNRAGIRRIIELESQVDALRERVGELTEELAALRAELSVTRRHAPPAPGGVVSGPVRQDLVPWRTRATAIVTWRPRGR